MSFWPNAAYRPSVQGVFHGQDHTGITAAHTGARFPVYPVSLLLPLLEQHQGDVWLPACKGADVAALRQHGKGQPPRPWPR